MYTVKLAAVVLSQPLSLFFNNCIKVGIFPAALKLARVRPLVMSTKTNVPNDYRPISLLPAISKLFEKLIQSRLMMFIKKHRLLNPCQYGFRANHSCCHALMVLTEFTRDTCDKKKYGKACFIDLKKAFDTINQKRLLCKCDSLGFRGTINRLLESYLTDRKQFVEINKKINNFQHLLRCSARICSRSTFVFAVY